jgi:hypothetical protein
MATPSLLENKPEAASAYDEITKYAKSLGKFGVEEKKTCLHFTAGKTAFLGIHPRSNGLRLTVVLSRDFKSKRIVKCEKASANRYHVDLNYVAADGLDEELKSLIKESYARSVARA